MTHVLTISSPARRGACGRAPRTPGRARAMVEVTTAWSCDSPPRWGRRSRRSRWGWS